MHPNHNVPKFDQIETDRLILRRFQSDDADQFMRYRNLPEVAEYQSWTSYSDTQTKAFIASQQNVQPGTPGDWFQFAITLKESGQLIGDCGLYTDLQEPPQGEIGFTLDPHFQGKGYAGEAVMAIFDYAFNTLKLHRIKGIADCLNTPSSALMERIGMRREAHFIQHVWFKGRWSDECWFAVLRSEWLERQNSL